MQGQPADQLLCVFGTNIKKRRKFLKLTQGMLARRAKCHSNVISLLERGVVDPKLTTSFKIAQSLKTTLNDLLS